MGESSRHHYLPQFYLNGFTDSSNQFYVYDVKRAVIKKGKHYPKSHFFEPYRNSILLKGKMDDFIEKLYSEADNIDKEIIKFIQEQEKPFTHTAYQIFQIQLFISHLHWRNPINDSIYSKEIVEKPLTDNLFNFFDAKTHEPVAASETEDIKNSDPFVKSFRSALGVVSWLKSQNKRDMDNWTISFSSKAANLISDNPIIRKTDTPDLFESPFVINLSKKFTLTRSLNPIKTASLPPEFSLFIALIQFLQAEYYVCCCDLEFLKGMAYISKQFDLENLKIRLFKIIED